MIDYLTFQLRRNGVQPLMERLADIEYRLDVLEAAKNAQTDQK